MNSLMSDNGVSSNGWVDPELHVTPEIQVVVDAADLIANRLDPEMVSLLRRLGQPETD